MSSEWRVFSVETVVETNLCKVRVRDAQDFLLIVYKRRNNDNIATMRR